MFKTIRGSLSSAAQRVRQSVSLHSRSFAQLRSLFAEPSLPTSFPSNAASSSAFSREQSGPSLHATNSGDVDKINISLSARCECSKSVPQHVAFRSLGGLSLFSFNVLYGMSASEFTNCKRETLLDYVKVLQDRNEYLEDTHTYLAAFIERQKEQIETLKQTVQTLQMRLV